MDRTLIVATIVWTCVVAASAVSAQAPAAAAKEPLSAPAQKGGQVVTQACTTCHTTFGRMLQVHRQTREQWKSTVYFMISRGAQVMPDEIEPVIDYLAATAGPQPKR